jgi:hypothetical protein
MKKCIGNKELINIVGGWRWYETLNAEQHPL